MINGLSKYKPVIVLVGVFVFSQSCAQTISFEKNASETEILQTILEARFDSSVNYLKWQPSAAEKVEFNGENGDGFLYSAIDTVYHTTSSPDKKIIVFHTTALNIIGKMIIPASSCTNCGVTVGYAELILHNGKCKLFQLKRHMGIHGTYRENNYRILMRQLKKEIVLRFDEIRESKGIETVLTTFYKNGNRYKQIVSDQNNEMVVGKNKKGYYSFVSDFYWRKDESLLIVKRGYRIDGKTGRKINIYETTNLKFSEVF